MDYIRILLVADIALAMAVLPFREVNDVDVLRDSSLRSSLSSYLLRDTNSGLSQHRTEGNICNYTSLLEKSFPIRYGRLAVAVVPTLLRPAFGATCVQDADSVDLSVILAFELAVKVVPCISRLALESNVRRVSGDLRDFDVHSSETP